MRILTARGRLCNVMKVEPMVEKLEVFNHVIHHNREVAMDMKVKPSCLRFLAGGGFGISETFIVGNLPFETVREIQKVLLEKGYYDFSMMEYQPVVPFDLLKLKVDGGVSLPYFEEVADASAFISDIGSCGVDPEEEEAMGADMGEDLE